MAIGYRTSTSLQPRLFANCLHQTLAEILPRMRYRHRAGFRWVSVLVMTAARALQSPAVSHQFFDELSALHSVYNTHQRILRRLWGQSRLRAGVALACFDRYCHNGPHG